MWEQVTIGKSGATVSRRRGVYRKESVHRGIDLVAEGERLAWLRRQGIPAPEVLDCGPGLLVTAEIPGRSAAGPWPAALRPRVVAALAHLTHALHDLPVAGCPFDRTLAAAIPEALTNDVDLDDLDAGRRGWTRERLVDELFATRPPDEDLVVCHGDLCLPNVIVDPESCEVTGVIDTERLGVADRWADLAIATRSLSSSRNPQYGAASADDYLRCYGIAPDGRKIAFYRLLDEFF